MAYHVVINGALTALMLNFKQHHLPVSLQILERVEKGERLGDWEFEFMENVIQEANRIKPVIDQHEDFQSVYAGAVHLYQRITSKALENELRSRRI